MVQPAWVRAPNASWDLRMEVWSWVVRGERDSQIHKHFQLGQKQPPDRTTIGRIRQELEYLPESLHDKLAEHVRDYCRQQGWPLPQQDLAVYRRSNRIQKEHSFPTERPPSNDPRDVVANLRGIEIQFGDQTRDAATLFQAAGPELLFPLKANDVAQKLSDRGFQGTMKKMPMGGDGPATKGVHELLRNLVDFGILNYLRDAGDAGARNIHSRQYYLTDLGRETLRRLEDSNAVDASESYS